MSYDEKDVVVTKLRDESKRSSELQDDSERAVIVKIKHLKSANFHEQEALSLTMNKLSDIGARNMP